MALILLDDLDKRILNALQQDASLSNIALAERVHASAPTCLRRVNRLVEEGVIAQQVAIIDRRKIGASLTVIVEITLDRQDEESQQAFETIVNQESAILQCYRVSAGPDFVLIIEVKDMPAYHELAHHLFAAQKNIRNVKSYFSIKRSKFEMGMPI